MEPEPVRPYLKGGWNTPPLALPAPGQSEPAPVEEEPNGIK